MTAAMTIAASVASGRLSNSPVSSRRVTIVSAATSSPESCVRAPAVPLTAVFDRLVQERPLAFRAALTVTPSPFAAAQCVAVFKDYQEVTPVIDNRNGDTFPLGDIRQWFNEFAELVWEKIEAQNV